MIELEKTYLAKTLLVNLKVCPASWRPGGKTLKPGLDLVGKI